MHGNEPAGVQALDILFKLLELEPETNPSFSFRGRLIYPRKCVRARRKMRHLEKDLNRMWTTENIARVKAAHSGYTEDLELKEMITIIEHNVETYQPIRSSCSTCTPPPPTGIFPSLPTTRRVWKSSNCMPRSQRHAGGCIRGTTLHYFNSDNFNRPTVGVCFESA